ncbi:HNH endonuclease [Candidatus Pacearchaeota archaeon]|jgi:5-methylcytosine-specific restriction protein A|nr:HNH endonuclease [Candidatus Pacearchaeota archaeon]
MPYKPARPCRQPGCPALTNDKTGYCEQHRKAALKEQDSHRLNANERGYNYRWHKYTQWYLAQNPLCVNCLKQNTTKAAECVDHVIPHKGDQTLFWDPDNHQALCLSCNSAKAAKQEGAFGNKQGVGE